MTFSACKTLEQMVRDAVAWRGGVDPLALREAWHARGESFGSELRLARWHCLLTESPCYLALHVSLAGRIQEGRRLDSQWDSL